jgi:hypothetical protein
MNGNWKLTATLLGLALLLVACQPAAAVEPTKSLSEVQTEVAQNVAAGLTQTAQAQPTATQTLTPEPTATASPTATATDRFSSTATLAVPATATPAFGSTPDRGQWLYNTPDDTGTPPTFAPGETFTVTWRVRNVGSTTWTSEYSFRYFLADPVLRLGATDILLPKDVPPGEEVDLTLTFKAPSAPGEYTTWWVVSNTEAANFLNVNFRFNVGSGPAPTAVPPTATSEATASTP